MPDRVPPQHKQVSEVPKTLAQALALDERERQRVYAMYEYELNKQTFQQQEIA